MPQLVVGKELLQYFLTRSLSDVLIESKGDVFQHNEHICYCKPLEYLVDGRFCHVFLGEDNNVENVCNGAEYTNLCKIISIN